MADITAGIGPELRALAFIVNQIRPSWPKLTIEFALADDHRDLGTLTRAAVQAAQTPATRHPNGIRTTFPGADGCSVCEQRERSTNTQPPPITRCETCGRVTDLEHSCRPAKPDWWPKAQQVTAQYSAAIRAARTVGDHATANQLAQRQRDELRAVMA